MHFSAHRQVVIPLAGGHSPLFHTGCPLQSNMPRSVIPQQFHCGLRESVPCGWTQSTLSYWMPVAIQHAPFRHTAAVSLRPKETVALRYLYWGTVGFIRFSFEIPQGNNARLTHSFPLRDDVERHVGRAQLEGSAGLAGAQCTRADFVCPAR